jgi:hypothetical protein
MIPEIIYLLCTLTCFGCAFLLLRTFHSRKSRLLFWASLHFAILGLANLLLFVDVIIYPQVSLLPWRNAITLGAVLVLLYGLVFESH